MRKQGKFEVHVAAPQMSYAEGLALFQQLEDVGLLKNKYFLDVFNVPQDRDYDYVLDTPPTGHDLDAPYFMSTAIVSSFAEAKKLVVEGMAILDRRGKAGNFEIERIIAEQTEDFFIDVEQEFPEFQRIDDSPEYENHLIFRGTLQTLPSNQEIVRFIQTAMGVTMHQLVDFARTPLPDENTRVSRIATIYQPSRSAALTFSKSLRQVDNTIGYSSIIAEQVCLVGEAKKQSKAESKPLLMTVA